MSLDVYLREEPKPHRVKCESCGHVKIENYGEVLFERNITHNLNTMAMEASIYEALWRPEEIGAKKAKDVIGKIGLGLDVLKADPAYFKKFNPANGWGNYEVLVEFVEAYYNACVEYPDADIEISR